MIQAAAGNGTFKVPRGASVALFALLIAFGVAGNHFRYEIFFNIQFVFGGIFALLALLLLGPGPGVLAGVLISSYTYVLWNHPYAIVIMTAEVLTVGVLTRRSKVGFVLADALYWLFIGMPLVVLFYWGVMHLPLYTATVTMLKQATNGIGNALVARMLYVAFSRRWKGEPLSMREVIFDLLVLFCLLPALFLIARESRNELATIDRSVRNSLQLGSQNVGHDVDSWLEASLRRIELLAWMATQFPTGQMSRSIAQVHASETDFLRIGLLDENATVIAYSPAYDELGAPNIGRNFRDRPFIPILRRTLKPMLSEVVMGRIGVPRPMVTALAPVVAGGRYAGYVTGILDLDRIDSLILAAIRGTEPSAREYVLLDRNGVVIATSRKNLKVMEPYAQEPGEVIRLDQGIFQLVPPNAKNISVSDRWKKAKYFSRIPVGGTSSWTLILEQPMAPFQKQVYERYSAELAWVFGILLAALVVAEVASRLVVRSFADLKEISSNIPARFGEGASIAWPVSAVAEANDLIENFRQMTAVLSRQVSEIRDLNATLEQRVGDRTRQLRESEEMYRTLVETADDIIMLTDLDGKRLLRNSSSYTSLGFSPDVDGDLDLFSRVHPDDAPMLATARARLLEQGHLTAEYRSRHKDGRWVHLLEKSSVIFDAEHAPLAILSIIRDITERKAAEDRVRQLVHEQQAILDTVPLGVAYIVNRRIVWANPAFESTYGFLPGEADGIGTRVLYASDEDYERIGKEGYRLIDAGETYSVELSVPRKSGERFWINLIGRAASGQSGLDGSIWIYQDITERKRLVTELERSEQYLRALVENASDAIFIHDFDGRIVDCNKQACDSLGYTRQEVLAKHVFDVDPDFSSDRDVGAWKELPRAGAMTIQSRHRRKNGTTFPVEVKIGLLHLATGSLAIAVARDVSTRKLAEDALQEKTRQLEELTRSLEERVQVEIALRYKSEQAMVQQAKLAAMGEMLGAIAHQWRQPLNALGLIVQNLRDAEAYGELDRDYLERTVEKSMSQIRHMSKTIDDFRTFFQPDKERTVFDAMQSVGDVISLFSAQLAASDIDVRFSCATHGATFSRMEDIVPCPEKSVRGFRNEFEHVVMNLVNNARESILERRESDRPGACARGLITFVFRLDGGVVRIEVSDNGGGIPAELVARVFEPYFTTKDPARGTGLGLYMSKIIIEEHMQGSLRAGGGVDGAVFTIELPRA